MAKIITRNHKYIYTNLHLKSNLLLSKFLADDTLQFLNKQYFWSIVFRCFGRQGQGQKDELYLIHLSIMLTIANLHSKTYAITHTVQCSEGWNCKILLCKDCKNSICYKSFMCQISTVDSGNSKRLNSKQSLISKHFWWNWAIVL